MQSRLNHNQLPDSAPSSCDNGTKKYSSKKCSARISPKKATLNGNFSNKGKSFDVKVVGQQNMKENCKKKVADDDNPSYEDPQDVIDKSIQKNEVSANYHHPTKDVKILLRHQKRKIMKKYEKLIVALMDKCEENVTLQSEKESQISKLKEKLKSVLEYNKMFGDDNDRLQNEILNLSNTIEQYKSLIDELQMKFRVVEDRNVELIDRVKQFEKFGDETQTAVPLVQVCISCSSRQILLAQATEHNARLNKEIHAMKDLLYRLNTQLSKYQAKLRSSSDYKVDPKSTETLESLIATTLERSNSALSNDKEEYATKKFVDVTGLLSAQALGPLFDAYQDNIHEKDVLIKDYEAQFEQTNTKLKDLLTENRTLKQRLKGIENELLETSKRERKIAVELETVDIEKRSLVERAENAETKLKEVYELYEDKVSSLMRDYETVHKEYFTVKNALAVSESKMARIDANVRERTVPADLHERRVESCKRLLEELKHQYSLETERLKDQIIRLQEEKRISEDKCKNMKEECDKMTEDLKEAEHNVGLYRKAASVFRNRLRSRERARHKRTRGHKLVNTQTLDSLKRIKQEIKLVKTRATSSLQELERRLIEQERRYAKASHLHQKEIDRAQCVIEHKESIIKNLIDKVADVEEVRLSQTNSQLLQGIIEELSPSNSFTEKKAKLVPSNGGYYQESRNQK